MADQHKNPGEQLSERSGEYAAAVEAKLAALESKGIAAKIWARDATAWTTNPAHYEKIRDRLGWLAIAPSMAEQTASLDAFAQAIIAARFRHVLLLGMGGSSLAPEVMQSTFGIARGHPSFGVLDSTDPATVRAFQRAMSPADTLYIVSSKTGATEETCDFYKYFYELVRQHKGERAGENFIAITDPDTPLQREAVKRRFRRPFLNPADIGGRYSALSYFGLVPAALMGVDVSKLLARAQAMRQACAASVRPRDNPGVWLGAALATLYEQGRDKVTFILSPGIDTFGYWVEQLIAESTGKSPDAGTDGEHGDLPPRNGATEGKGLVPIEGEPLGTPEVYGADRVFVYMRLDGAENEALDAQVDALQRAAQPVIRLQLRDVYDLGAEFFRWEFATAVAGALMGINPFDEPNVAESKANTQRVLEAYVANGKLPALTPSFSEEGIALYWNDAPRQYTHLAACLRAFLDQTKPGDYIALLVYLTRSPANEKVLTAIRAALRARYRAATTAGYGPRFLHSTGQLHKGGANNGVFIQITGADAQDADIPGKPYSFGVLKQAQALGDWEALEKHARRVIRIDLGIKELEELGYLDFVARSNQPRVENPAGAGDASRCQAFLA